MPWGLTTSVQTGDLDSAPYSQIEIQDTRFDGRRNMIMLEWEHGNTVDGEWVPGHTPVGKEASHMIQEQEFIDFLDANQDLYNQVKAVYYAYLASIGKIDPGSVAG